MFDLRSYWYAKKRKRCVPFVFFVIPNASEPSRRKLAAGGFARGVADTLSEAKMLCRFLFNSKGLVCNHGLPYMSSPLDACHFRFDYM